MANTTFKAFLGAFEPKSRGGKAFVEKHTVELVDLPSAANAAAGWDANKVIKADDVKVFDRKKNRYGYNPGEDEEAGLRDPAAAAVMKNEELQAEIDKILGEKNNEEIAIEEDLIAEHLHPKMGAGKYIEDFIHSTNPRFVGKTKEERTKMALAAYNEAKRRIHEEKIDESVMSHEEALSHLTKHGWKLQHDFKTDKTFVHPWHNDQFISVDMPRYNFAHMKVVGVGRKIKHERMASGLLSGLPEHLANFHVPRTNNAPVGNSELRPQLRVVGEDVVNENVNQKHEKKSFNLHSGGFKVGRIDAESPEAAFEIGHRTHGVSYVSDDEGNEYPARKDRKKPIYESAGQMFAQAAKQLITEASFRLNPAKKGMFDGKNVSQIKADFARLKRSGPHPKGSAAATKEHEDIFAINAKEHKFRK